MNSIFNLINQYVFSYILRFIMSIFANNFSIAIFVLTVIINLALIPLTIKTQKSMVQQTRIRPKLDKLKAECGDDKQKFAQAQQQLFQKENISLSGGCLPLIIRLVLLLSIFYLVTSPISYLMNVDKTVLEAAKKGLEGIGVLNLKGYAPEIQIMQFINGGDFSKITDASLLANVNIIKEAAQHINLTFFGIDLTKTPVFSFNFANATIEWVIPLLSFASALASSFISMRLQKAVNPDAPSMALMMLVTPFISLWIAFKAPCALGLYWTFSSLVAGLLQAGVQYVFSPAKLLAKERAKSIYKIYDKESKQSGSLNK